MYRIFLRRRLPKFKLLEVVMPAHFIVVRFFLIVYWFLARLISNQLLDIYFGGVVQIKGANRNFSLDVFKTYLFNLLFVWCLQILNGLVQILSLSFVLGSLSKLRIQLLLKLQNFRTQFPSNLFLNGVIRIHRLILQLFSLIYYILHIIDSIFVFLCLFFNLFFQIFYNLFVLFFLLFKVFYLFFLHFSFAYYAFMYLYFMIQFLLLLSQLILIILLNFPIFFQNHFICFLELFDLIF